MAKEIQIYLSEGMLQIATIGWSQQLTGWQSLLARPVHGFSDERSRNLIDSQGDASLSLGTYATDRDKWLVAATAGVAIAAWVPRIRDSASNEADSIMASAP